MGVEVWVILDRLDEAFAGYPSVEIPALRALFRTYLDLQAFTRIKIKLFVRTDLFRKITRGGFVNLTHINAKRVQIDWSDEDLHALLCNRLRNCSEFLQMLNLPKGFAREQLLEKIFPKQIDFGEKKPLTWSWITSRIRDANGTMPPRNLIDLLNKAKGAQIKREERDARDFLEQTILFEPEALRKGLDAL